MPEEKTAYLKPASSDLGVYLRVAAPIFFGLFLAEYPPLFLFGYWSWSGTVHKVLSGMFLVLNLGLAEYAVRRSRRRRRADTSVSDAAS